MSEIPAETLAALAARIAAVQKQLAEERSHNAQKCAEERSRNIRQFEELKDMVHSLHETMRQSFKPSKGNVQATHVGEIIETTPQTEPVMSQPLLPTAPTVALEDKVTLGEIIEAGREDELCLSEDHVPVVEGISATKEHVQEEGHANPLVRLPRSDVPHFCGADGEEWLFQMTMGRSKVAEQKLNALRIPVHNNEPIPECLGLFSLPRPPEFPTLRTRLIGRGE